MDTYAAIKVALMDGTESLTQVLDRLAVDERAWRAHERSMSIALARESSEGRSELATELRDAIAKARRVSEPPVPEDEPDLDEYVSIRAEIDEAEDPKQALEQLGLSAAEWDELRRAWTRRALSDRELAGELRRKLAEARRALRSTRD